MSDDQIANQSFMRSVLSGTDGTASTARLCTLLVVVFALLWVTFLVGLKREIPDLGGLTIWVTTVTASLYGANKLAAVVTAKKDCQ